METSVARPAHAQAPAWYRRRGVQRVTGQVLAYVLILAGAVVALLPIAWMLSTALKEEADLAMFGIRWIPNPVAWHNFIDVFHAIPFLRFLWNTVIVTTGALAGIVVSSSLVAYGFGRLRFPGRDTWFVVLLSTMMLPGIVTLIPTFILFKYLGWIDTFYPLIVPSWFGGGAFNVFLLRQFLMTIPYQMDEAALIDGCGLFGVFWKILLPQLKPALATVALMAFMGLWNDFMGPLVYLNSVQHFTLALGLALFKGMYLVKWNLLMAASLLFMLPCVLLFYFGQRLFIQGVVVTGVKG